MSTKYIAEETSAGVFSVNKFKQDGLKETYDKNIVKNLKLQASLEEVNSILSCDESRNLSDEGVIVYLINNLNKENEVTDFDDEDTTSFEEKTKTDLITFSEEIGLKDYQVIQKIGGDKLTHNGEDFSAGTKILKLGKDFYLLGPTPDVYDMFKITCGAKNMSEMFEQGEMSLDFSINGLKEVSRDKEKIIYEIEAKKYNKLKFNSESDEVVVIENFVSRNGELVQENSDVKIMLNNKIKLEEENTLEVDTQEFLGKEYLHVGFECRQDYYKIQNGELEKIYVTTHGLQELLGEFLIGIDSYSDSCISLYKDGVLIKRLSDKETGKDEELLKEITEFAEDYLKGVEETNTEVGSSGKEELFKKIGFDKVKTIGKTVINIETHPDDEFDVENGDGIQYGEKDIQLISGRGKEFEVISYEVNCRPGEFVIENNKTGDAFHFFLDGEHEEIANSKEGEYFNTVCDCLEGKHKDYYSVNYRKQKQK